MKAILPLIGIALSLTGNARQNPTEMDSLNLVKKTYELSGNTVFHSLDDNQTIFRSVTFKETSLKFDKTNGSIVQPTYRDKQQNQSNHAFISTGFFGTSKGNVPFWMRSMKYGSVPLDGISVSLIGGVVKQYASENPQKLMDWGAGFEGRINAGNHSEFMLIESYAKIRLSIFELKGGRFREQIGLVDSTLSSGAFSLSGNALGVPKIEAGIPDFWNVPLTGGVIAIKGNVAHGWMDTQKLNKNNNNTILLPKIEAYLHQLSAYGRIGKVNWKVKLYGGINHMVVWGHEKEMYPGWGLSDFETFKYVLMGKAYGTNSIPTSKVGNHVGSIDQAIEIKTNHTLLTGYHQFFYDVGALVKLANAKDGLWGISLKNRQSKSSNLFWNKFLFEFLYSKSQGGEVDSKPRASGAEDYYNNFEYYNGWSYNGENLGNPLFTSKNYIKDGYPTASSYQYFANNRMVAFHVGSEIGFNKWFCRGLLTYSLNYGTYSTSPAERSLGNNIVYHNPPYFPKVKQISAYVESHREFRNGFELGIQLAFDKGELLYNSIGSGISLSKRW